MAPLTDRNGTVHTFTFDVLARQTADAVTTLGTGVDGAVRRLETSFNALGLPYQMTSFDAARIVDRDTVAVFWLWQMN